MENVCKSCGVVLLKHQDVCPCCGMVKDHDAHDTPSPFVERELADSLIDPYIGDRHAGY